MGMYVNETALLCVSPRIPGDPSDYHRETVRVSLAMNGQDFSISDSSAKVTFVGTGSDTYIWKWIIALVLIALLIQALIMFCGSIIHTFKQGTMADDLPKPSF